MQQPPPPAPPPYGQPPSPYGQPPSGFAQPYGNMQPPVRRRRRWWLWGCGGCAVLAIILVAVAAAGFIRIFTGSPLRQFPTEAGASTVSDTINTGNGQSTETVVIDDPHSLTDVETYYQTALSSGAWSVESADPGQATSGDTWHFSHSGSGAQTGAVQFTSINGGTQITAQYNF